MRATACSGATYLVHRGLFHGKPSPAPPCSGTEPWPGTSRRLIFIYAKPPYWICTKVPAALSSGFGLTILIVPLSNIQIRPVAISPWKAHTNTGLWTRLVTRYGSTLYVIIEGCKKDSCPHPVLTHFVARICLYFLLQMCQAELQQFKTLELIQPDRL